MYIHTNKKSLALIEAYRQQKQSGTISLAIDAALDTVGDMLKTEKEGRVIPLMNARGRVAQLLSVKALFAEAVQNGNTDTSEKAVLDVTQATRLEEIRATAAEMKLLTPLHTKSDAFTAIISTAHEIEARKKAAYRIF